jgi:NADH-quinone oxidoreductase subunit G
MANISVHEAKTTQTLDDDTNVETQFNFSMEGKNSHSSADMPFSWAPGWNSNQSILQYQTQVNGKLSQQTQNIILTFKACENESEDKGKGLAHLWPASSKKSSNYKTDLTTTQLRFNPQAHWSSYEWQSAKNPEFSALSLGNVIFVSKAFSHTIHVKSGDYVVISSDQLQVIAQLAIDPQLEAQQSYGYIDELSFSTGEIVVEVTIASAQDKERYQAELEVSLHQLEQEKAEILNSLKQVDQYIPIRMISGGLDDV